MLIVAHAQVFVLQVLSLRSNPKIVTYHRQVKDVRVSGRLFFVYESSLRNVDCLEPSPVLRFLIRGGENYGDKRVGNVYSEKAYRTGYDTGTTGRTVTCDQ